MSEPPKQGRSSIGAVENQQRADEKRRKREQNFDHAAIREIAPAINAVANQLASNEEAQETSEHSRGVRENITIILLLLAFAAAGVGDIIFYRTMLDGRDGARPYIWLANETEITSEKNLSYWLFWSPIPNGNGLGQVVWQTYYSNFGKSLALQTKIRPEITLVGGFEKAGNVIRDVSSIPVPPSSETVSIAMSEQVLTKEQFYKLLSMHEVITLRTKITYTDSYGNPYETDVCLSLLAGGGKKQCPGNEMK